MKLKILEFRASMAYRFIIIADKVFNWNVKRHNKLHQQIEIVKEQTTRKDLYKWAIKNNAVDVESEGVNE